MSRKKRWVYGFDQIAEAQASVDGDWESTRGLLGGKGANLGDMIRIGVPVPPGFTITTEACNAYNAADGVLPEGLWDQVLAAMGDLEKATGKEFGNPANPLLVACRSGAKFSMPGMMDTVLDIGLNEDVVEGMIRSTNDERFVLDSYRRLVQMFGSVVLGVGDAAFESILRAAREKNDVASDAELPGGALREVIDAFHSIICRQAEPFPADPLVQLRMAVEAVFDSWRSKRAHDYRVAAKIAHDLGTAVNVVAMVFGNTGEDSATGVAMSRDATTGEPHLEGDFLINAQGEDVVGGIRETLPISDLAQTMPEVAAEFADIAKRLEHHYRDMQDMEFTVERGRLWLLQTRSGKRTAQAAVRIAVDQANEGLITRQEAVLRVTPEQIDFFLHPQFSTIGLENAASITTGLNVSPGAAVGVAVFDPDIAQRWAGEGRQVVLVRHETRPDDVHGMLAAAGILTSSGGRTSHAALVARQFGKPAVVGATDIQINSSARSFTVGRTEIKEGDWISVDGTTGNVYAGKLETMAPNLENPWLSTLLEWADEFRVLGVRANADDPVEAERARRYGANGIGLCRTEHMFFAPERLPIMQRMITAPSSAERREALAELLPMQRGDFEGMFRAMAGQPVIIRLLDPPLHEFLPSFDELTQSATDLQIRLVNAADLATVNNLVDQLTAVRTMLTRVDGLRESNPMLGLRGVRLGLRIPELIRMQTRAIVEAAIAVEREGVNVLPEIMVPLVSHASEMAAARALIESEMQTTFDEQEALGNVRTSMNIPIGAMIEVPRAALTAGEIAEYADFFSFGTNDLTQMTMAISRDDAEASFLLDYLADRIIGANPFHTIDTSGVGRLMRLAVADGRFTTPDLHVGICGEHGGEPASIALCHQLGLDYVSCSAYRVPVARLAAAHAALNAAHVQ